jgi:hypothetical protein
VRLKERFQKATSGQPGFTQPQRPTTRTSATSSGRRPADISYTPTEPTSSPGSPTYTPWTPIYSPNTPRSPPGSPMFIPIWCFLHSPDNLAILQGRPGVPYSRASHHVLRHCPLYIHATTRTVPYVYAGPQHSATFLMLRLLVSAHRRLDRASEFDKLLDDTVLRHERVTLQTCHRIHQRTLMDRRSVDPQLRLLLHSEFCS